MQIHLISFNVPYPPNYGGIIDVFYKVKALQAQGFKIHLHCFDSGRGIKTELSKYCEKVFYYKQSKSLLKVLYAKPFSVTIRNSKKLYSNLLVDNNPIIFEGIQTSYWLNNYKLSNRVKIIRPHNIEHENYKTLKQNEHILLRKIFFHFESLKLKKQEQVFKNANLIAAISPNDASYYQKLNNNTFWLPPFHSNTKIQTETGSGSYAIFHGNLSVSENIESVLFIIKTFHNTDIHIIIAGNSPSSKLQKAINKEKNITLFSNPSFSEMIDLIKKAHLHLLPTFLPSGIKLKLIESLYLGRHCLVNKQMVNGTGLEKLCHIAESSEDFLYLSKKLMSCPFENKDLIIRKEILYKKFDNDRNASLLKEKIIQLQHN